MSLTVHDMEQRSEAWYAVRCGIVTASVVGNLITPTLKVAANDTSRGLVATLAAERITGRVEEGYTSSDMLRGIMDEPVARAHYAEHHAPVTGVGFMVREFGTARLGYSPDGLVVDDGLIEIKSRIPREHVRITLTGTIPHDHMAQMQAGMLVSGRAWCDYISWCGGLPMWTKRVDADDEWQTAILDALTAADQAIDATVTAYTDAVAGLPATERATYYDDRVRI